MSQTDAPDARASATPQPGTDTAGSPPKQSVRRVTLSSFIGNTIEYYDFLLYGTASALVFPQVFFPSADPVAGTLASFATFGVGFLARPLGGIYFGRRGDLAGRKSTLVLTLFLMGVSTFLVGCLPSFDQVGILAPVLLVVLRFVQGFAVGGEWGGAMLMVVESAPPHRRGFFSAWPNTGGFSGQLLATGAFAMVSMLPDDQLHAWGWRVPFLASIVLVAVGMYMRSRLGESPVFTQVVQAEPRRTNPLMDILRNDWRRLVLVVLLRFPESVPFFLLTVFALSYAPSQFGVDKTVMLDAVLIVSVLAFPAHGLFGALSDRIGRRPVYVGGALLAAALAVPFFLLLQTGSTPLIWLGYILIINLAHNSINAVQPAFFSELFGAKVRYSGAAVGREVGSIFAGGLTPLIATALVQITGGGWSLVAGYVVVTALITAVAAYLAPETAKQELDPGVETPA